MFIGSTLSLSLPLKIYFYLLAFAAFMSYIRWTLLGKFFMKKVSYRVFDVIKIGEHIRLILKPGKEKLEYYPGQFVFVEFPGKRILSESHPFSIASSPDASYIELGIKAVGTYTNKLASLNKDDKVLLDGPYGRFSYKYYRNKSLVWIAGGIGVVPFVAMAKNMPNNIKTTLFYSVKNPSEAFYLKELIEISKQNRNFQLILWESSKRGRFGARDIPNILPENGYFICGPEAMMKSLFKQLLSEGVPDRNIHTEEFSLM
jgi:3-phenylpropionate/trans-cinnamate dioxygenase ferredoxin reductase subunit